MKSFKQGDIVRYADAWCEPSEKEQISVVIEAYDDVQRCTIARLNTKMFIAPQETVTYEMIEKVR